MRSVILFIVFPYVPSLLSNFIAAFFGVIYVSSANDLISATCEYFDEDLLFLKT